jgi:hypothetical protein
MKTKPQTNSTIKLITALAESRTKEEIEKRQLTLRLRNEKSRRWSGVLAALEAYEQARPGSVEIEMPTENIETSDIIVFLQKPYRRIVLSEARFCHIVGVGNGEWPSICERRNGFPLDAAETPSELVVTMLEILADHLNASQPEQAPMEEAA